MTETTHGATEKPPGNTRSKEMIRLIDTINATLQRGGSVLIPVFALGRMQEILAILHDARKFNRLAPAPVFASGLGMDICDYMDDIAKKTGLVHFTRTILKDLKVKKSPRDHCSRQGTAHTGHLCGEQRHVGRKNRFLHSRIFARGQRQTQHLLCGLLRSRHSRRTFARGQQRERNSCFEAVNVKTRIRAQIERFEFSGHASRDELLNHAAVSCKPRSIVLTHGDPPARAWFAEQLAVQLPNAKVLDPVPLQTYQV